MRDRTRRTYILLALIGTFAACSSSARAGIPGTRPKGYAPSRASVQESRSLAPVITEIGRIGVSVDGAASAGDSSVVQVEKPSGATVRRAFLMAATTGFSRHRIGAGDVTIDGVGVTWNSEVPTALDSYNYFTEITPLVAGKLDAAAAGRVDFTIREAATLDVDGVALVVVFDDPSLARDVSVVLFFGAQDPAGGAFSVGLSSPVDTNDPNLWIDFCVGVSYSFQGPQVTDQFSEVEVNGKRLTSSAGGQDDGGDATGSLLTVGGLDDSPANPDPLSPPLDFDTDDERYDLVPYVEDGDTRITIETSNPSLDDNLFFACLSTSEAVSQAEALFLTPIASTGAIGTPHTVTATFQDSLGSGVDGADVTFDVFSGPNSGATGTGTTDADGHAQFTYTGDVVGIDSIRANVSGTSGTLVSNVVSREWTEDTGGGTDDYVLLLSPNSSSGPVGYSHNLTASLTNNGNPEAGRTITFDVVAGPHAGVLGTGTTDSEGIAGFQYTGTTAGVDSIVAHSTIDTATVTSNTAVQEWTEDTGGTDDYSLTLAPVNSSGFVGTLCTLTATLSNKGAAVAGQRVVFDILVGPNAGRADTLGTTVDGTAQFLYTSAAAGVDSIVARAVLGSAPATVITSNVAARDWTEDTNGTDTYVLILDPVYSSGPVGSTLTLTATFTVNGVPRPSQEVDFSVFAGPHAGTGVTGVTDTNGETTFAYTGVIAGVDSIVATIALAARDRRGPSTRGTADVASNVAVRVWTGEGTRNYSVTLFPDSASNPVGTVHTVSATVVGDGVALVGVRIDFAVLSGPHAGTSGADTTDSAGEATFGYVGSLIGEDTIRASALVGGMSLPSNTVTATWTDDGGGGGGGGTDVALDIKPTSCVNPVNTTSKGVTPAALLGSDSVDVRQIEASTLRLEGVPPLRYNYDDVSRPGPDVECGCSSEGPDGYLDMTLKFDTPTLIAALGPVTDREVRTVTLTGVFKDGSRFTATDCILIIDQDTHTGGGGDNGDHDADPSGPATFGLDPASPNPFNPVTSISYRIPEDGDVRLAVYDVTGRRVAVLVDTFRPAGRHTVTWAPRHLASGVYFYRLESGGRSTVRRAILLK